MSTTVSCPGCGTSVGLSHKADIQAVLFGYELKAFVLLRTELDKAGILEDTAANVFADEQTRQDAEALLAALQQALEV